VALSPLSPLSLSVSPRASTPGAGRSARWPSGCPSVLWDIRQSVGVSLWSLGLFVLPGVRLLGCPSVCQSICLSIGMSAWFAGCLSVRLLVYWVVHLSVKASAFPSGCLPDFLGVCLSICWSIGLSICLSKHLPSIGVFAWFAGCLSVHLSVCWVVHLSCWVSSHPLGHLSVLGDVCLLGCPPTSWGVPLSVGVFDCPSVCPSILWGIWLPIRVSVCLPGHPSVGASPWASFNPSDCFIPSPGEVGWGPPRDGCVTAVPLRVPRPSSSGAGPGATCWSAAGRRSWPRPSGTASGAARLAWRSWQMARSHLRCSRCGGALTSPPAGEGGPGCPWGVALRWPRSLHPAGAGPQAHLAGGQPRGGRRGRSEQRGGSRPLQGKVTSGHHGGTRAGHSRVSP